MSHGLLCDTCRQPTVLPAGENPEGFRLYRCSRCREVKRWCPVCDQGWILHWRYGDVGEFYVCHECEATWKDIASANSTNFDRRISLEPSFYVLSTQIRDYEPAGIAGPKGDL